MYPLQFLDLLHTKLGKYTKLKTLHIDTLQLQRYSNIALYKVVEGLINKFESDIMSAVSLHPLIVRDKLDQTDFPAVYNFKHTYGYVFEIPENFRIIEEYFEYENTITQIKPITHDYYTNNIKNPKRKPSIDYLFWALDIGDDGTGTLRREIITDSTVTDVAEVYYHIAYIKNPTKFDFVSNTIESELDKNTLDKVAELTISLIYNDYSKIGNNEQS